MLNTSLWSLFKRRRQNGSNTSAKILKKVREMDLNFKRLRYHPFHRWENHILANQERAHQTRCHLYALETGCLFTPLCVFVARFTGLIQCLRVAPVHRCFWPHARSDAVARATDWVHPSGCWRIFGCIRMKTPSLLLHGDKMIPSAASCWSSVVNEADGWRTSVSPACERMNTLYHMCSISFNYKYLLKGARWYSL